MRTALATRITYLALVVVAAAQPAAPLTFTPTAFEQRDGREVGWAWMTREGATAIRTVVDAPALRQGFEQRLTERAYGYDRSHSQGAGTGVESPHGILLAPREVNRVLQNHGVEASIRDLHEAKAPGVSLYLTTETMAHERSPFLKSIHYRVEAEQAGRRAMLWEASIAVDRPGEAGREPRVRIEAERYSNQLERYLAEPPPETIKKANEVRERLLEKRRVEKQREAERRTSAAGQREGERILKEARERAERREARPK